MKTSPARDFGVQSFCFRNFKDNAEVARKVREIGLDKIEICGIHGDFSNSSSWKETVRTYADAGVAVVSIGVQTFNGEDHEEGWFERVVEAGASHISCHYSVDTFPVALKKTARWAENYGIRIGIHTHGGYRFGGSPDVVRHLMELGGPRVGLCLDTAWVLQIGPRLGNPVAWAKEFAGRIHGVHYKDFTFASDAGWSDTVVGEGNLDLPALVAALEDGGFDGMAVLEYEADPENPVPALKECVQRMRALQ